jgi:hypothetical protein
MNNMTMKYIVIEAPSLTDEAAVNLQDFFSALMHAFGDHYHYQIERYYRESIFGSAIDSKVKSVEGDPPF